MQCIKTDPQPCSIRTLETKKTYYELPEEKKILCKESRTIRTPNLAAQKLKESGLMASIF